MFLEGDGGMLAFFCLYKIVVYISLFSRPKLSKEMSVTSNLFLYVCSTSSHSNSIPHHGLLSLRECSTPLKLVDEKGHMCSPPN